MGLIYHKTTKKISVRLNHPLSKLWLFVFKPLWKYKYRNKCKLCYGSGWDGIGYILTCSECGGTGKSIKEG